MSATPVMGNNSGSLECGEYELEVSKWSDLRVGNMLHLSAFDKGILANCSGLCFAVKIISGGELILRNNSRTSLL